MKLCLHEKFLHLTGKMFHKSSLALFINSVLCLPVFASIVRDDIDYLYYRDFAENRAQFQPGNISIPIYDKSGHFVGALDRAPMPDWSGLMIRGVGTLIAPGYLASAAHTGGYNNATFGYHTKNPDNHQYTYLQVAHNPLSDTEDFALPRLNKIVTEAMPMTIRTGTYAQMSDHNRYTVFYRAGTGTQYIRSADGTQKLVASPHIYPTGGTFYEAGYLDRNYAGMQQPDLFAYPSDSPLTTLQQPGDSGSPIIAWDNLLKQWLYVGSLFGHYVSSGVRYDNWSMVSDATLAQAYQNDIDPDVVDTDNATPIQWNATQLVQNNSHWVWHGMDPSAAALGAVFGLAWTNGVSSEVAPSGLNAGKNLTFGGAGGTIILNQDVNMGAGVLTFNNDYTLKPATNQTWMGGGVIINKNHQLTWQVNGVAGDSLHKLGTGTLYVNATGVNPGELSIGEGTAILAQRPDTSGNVQAFSVLDIVSGRPTVVLTDNKQVNPDNIYFGFRGGRLDLNGNDLAFTHIHNVDSGAQLVNHNLNKNSVITITGNSGDDVFLGKLGEDQTTLPNGKLSIMFNLHNANSLYNLAGGSLLNGKIAINTGTLLLSGFPSMHADGSLYQWQPEIFDVAKSIDVSKFAVLQIGSFATLNGNINAAEDSLISLGYSDASDFTSHFDTTKYDAAWTKQCTVFDSISCAQAIPDSNKPASRVNGDLTLADNARAVIGNAILNGAINGGGSSTVLAGPRSEWNLLGDSAMGNLIQEKGSHINLNGGKGQYHSLEITNLLLSSGTVGMNVDLYKGEGDSLTLNNKASGSLKLDVNNLGVTDGINKPVSQLTVIKTNHELKHFDVSLTNGFVDAGEYRYLLSGKSESSNGYYLYNRLLMQQTKAAPVVNDESTPASDPASASGPAPVIAPLPAYGPALVTAPMPASGPALVTAPMPASGPTPVSAPTFVVHDKPFNPVTDAKSDKPEVVIKQKNWISRRTNAILSEDESRFAMQSSQQHAVHDYLESLDANHNGMWINADASRQRHNNVDTRLWYQNLVNTQVGGDMRVDMQQSSLLVGGVFTQTKSNGNFDGEASSDSVVNAGTVYSKLIFPTETFIAVSASYGHYSSDLTVDAKNSHSSNMQTYAVGVGQKFSVAGLNIQPSFFTTLFRNKAEQYSVDDAKVHSGNELAQQYQAGVKIDYPLTLSQVKTRPWISASYIKNKRDNAKMTINQQTFAKGNSDNISELAAGVTVSPVPALQFTVYGSYSDGETLDSQRSAGVKVKWRW
ncbi:S6 family peptidase [Buttiauxella noackiae]|uniref:S6 family peptidase n=1 Tax=Buttiauxella noackiae TaxID=82992 RepID=UPI000689AD75|nr:S6 family peptidase [Buttiauxella noackiae]